MGLTGEIHIYVRCCNSLGALYNFTFEDVCLPNPSNLLTFPLKIPSPPSPLPPFKPTYVRKINKWVVSPMLHLQILVFISLAIGLEAGANYPPEIMFEIFLTFAFISLLPWRVCLAICYLIRQPKFRLILLSNLVEVWYLLDRNS